MLSAKNLSIGYAGASLVDGVDFALGAGDVLAVVGHNGSGKTTFIKTLLGLIPPIQGVVDGADAGNIAYLGQLTDFDRRFPVRVRDLAAMGAWQGFGWRGAFNKARQRTVDGALERAGIADIAFAPLHELSSGQLQRALFARTIVQDAPIILLDEPFAAVDQKTEAALLALIDEWAASGRAIVLVLHDLSAVLQHCTKALLLGQSIARFGEPTQVLTPLNLVDQGYLSESQSRWFRDMYRPRGDAHV
ncbi:MAG: metal ABC transporter ATP-binding protein [Gammaproteobacteria bacterium]|nr:metal ABC transporter ATP-binding protein [Gammaproteobacteria bacterium]